MNALLTNTNKKDHSKRNTLDPFGYFNEQSGSDKSTAAYLCVAISSYIVRQDRRSLGRTPVEVVLALMTICDIKPITAKPTR